MNELYEELRYGGLDHDEAMELADSYYSYTDYVPVKKDKPWQVALALAMIFLCMFCIFLGG
jgi:hypothetical protein